MVVSADYLQWCHEGPVYAAARFELMADERIVAVGLLTRSDLRSLGPTFDRAWPIEDTPCFSELLLAIDEADRELQRDGDLTMKMKLPE